MIGNLTIILVESGRGFFNIRTYLFRNLNAFIKTMKKSENKDVMRNGLCFLAKICNKFYCRIDNIKSQYKAIKFLAKVIVNEQIGDNLINALTCFENKMFDIEIAKNTGCLSRLASLLRFPINYCKNYFFNRDDNFASVHSTILNIIYFMPAEESESLYVSEALVNSGVLESFFYLMGHKDYDKKEYYFPKAILHLHPNFFSLIFKNEVFMEKLMERTVLFFL